MEVTHRDDHVTHAVIGGSEKIDFGIEDSAFFMEMLSASLYKDQRMAVAREVLCNADDAHKENGVTVPFTVTLTSEKLIIRDFGPGIPHDMIGQVYGTYGKSTKRGNDKATGGFGLGCKSPFAYTDNFQVTSFNNGTKTVYRMSKSDSEVDGKPSIVKIVSVPTQETGLEVSINMQTSGDVRSFALRIQKVLANGEMNALYNGVQAKVLPFSKMENGYLLTDETPLLEEYRILVRYGAVLYPISAHEDYSREYEVASRLVESVDYGFALILQAKPGSLSLTPSREALTITSKTSEAVKELLTNFNNNFQSKGVMVHASNISKKAVEKAASNGDFKILTERPVKGALYKKYIPETMDDADFGHYIHNDHSLASWRLFKQYPGIKNRTFLLKDMRLRAALLSKNENDPNRGLMQTFKRALRFGEERQRVIAARSAFHRKVVIPVVKDFVKTKFLLKNNLYTFVPHFGWSDEHSYYSRDRVSYQRALGYLTDSLDKFFIMQKRVIVLTHDVEKAAERLRVRVNVQVDETNMGGFLVYQTSRAQSKLEEARAYFKSLKNYTFIDLTEAIERREPTRRTSSGKKEKLKGFATLRGVKGNNIFDWTQITTTKVRVDKPEAYAELYGKSHHRGQDCLVGFNSKQAEILSHMYGDHIAAVINAGQISNLKAAGEIPEVSKWLPKKIISDLENNKELLSALPGTWNVLTNWLTDKGVDVSFVKMLLNNSEVVTALNLPKLKDLTIEQKKLLRIYNTFKNEYLTLAESSISEHIEKMQPNRALVKFVEKLKGNVLLPLLDTGAVKTVLEGDDIALKTKTIKLIKTFLKG